MKPPRRRLIIGCVFLGVAGLAGLLLILGKPNDPPALPDPNGYDDFVQAGEMLSGDDHPGFQELRDMDEADLRTALATSLGKHAEALAQARKGLSRPCRVRLDYDATSTSRLSELSTIKRLARVFIALGRLAEFEDRNEAASEFYLDLIRLGQESARGGVLINSMSGRGIETVGLDYLERLTPKLKAKDCREAVNALENIDERSEPLEAILRQEKDWTIRAFGLRGQFLRVLTYRSLRQLEQTWSARMLAQASQRRSLVIKLAVRAYELENDSAPDRLDELVPEYLKRLSPEASSNPVAHYQLPGTD